MNTADLLILTVDGVLQLMNAVYKGAQSTTTTCQMLFELKRVLCLALRH